MKKTSFTIIALTLVLPLLVAAKPTNNNLPKITGGGWADNDNAGPGFPADMATQFGFTAHATDEGVEATHSFFDEVEVTTYDARGQFQARTVDETTGETVDKGHGEVVCIANFGPSEDVDGGGDPDGDVWEIRVRFEDPDFGEIYGSFLVQDNGKSDYLDENFAFARIGSDECGDAEFFQLEEVTRGQIKVH